MQYKKGTGMIYFGKIALAIWAAGIAYVGYLLISGQMGVAQAAMDAGRTSDVIVQGIFMALVFIFVAISCALFLFVGVLNE